MGSVAQQRGAPASARRRQQHRLDHGRISAPQPKGHALADEERTLLETPLRLDRGDIYPATAEPHFLIEPPAPELGEVNDRFVELPPIAGSRGAADRNFRRMKKDEVLAKDRTEREAAARAGVSGGAGVGADGGGAGVGAAALADAEHASLLAHPSGGVQGIALLAGLLAHLSQGALCGASLLQLAATPWPGGGTSGDVLNSLTLVRPMAYATVALPLNRTLSMLALASFIASCDLHAAAPRAGTALLLFLHACVVLTCVLELPTCVALTVGRAEREPALASILSVTLVNSTADLEQAIGSDPAAPATGSMLPPPPPPPHIYRPDLLPEMALEEGGGFFSTALSAQQLGFWEGLLFVRAILSTLAWILSCLMQSHMAFGVPPVSEGSVGYLNDW